MTIDEAIMIEKYYGKKDEKALKELQNEFPMIEGITDNNLHEQLAEWLEELKDARKGFNENHRAGYKHGFNDGYIEGINDFTEKTTKIVYEANDRNKNPQPRDMVADIHYKLIELAEQLKEGEIDA